MSRYLVVWYNAEGLRFCDQCRTYMALDCFTRNRASSAGDGYQRVCRVCSRRLRHDRYLRRRKAEIAYARAWQAAHPERIREINRCAKRVFHHPMRQWEREQKRQAHHV